MSDFRGLLQVTAVGEEEAAREKMLVGIEAANRALASMFVPTGALPSGVPDDATIARGAAGVLIDVLCTKEGSERLTWLLKTVATDASLRSMFSGNASLSGQAGFALHTLVAAGIVVARESLKLSLKEAGRGDK